MRLFESGITGTMVTRNRIALAPMGPLGLLDLDLGVSQRLIDFYVARAKGGAGMIMTGATLVNRTLEAGFVSYMLRFDGPEYISRLSELCEAVQHYGAKLVIQLSAGFGRRTRFPE